MCATARRCGSAICSALVCVIAALTPATEAQAQREALDVRLSFPTDVAVTTGGATLIADTGNAVVRRLRPNGTLEIVTGAGIADAPGARLVGPTGVAVTADGVIVIADPGAHRVWWLPPGGNLMPLAGTGVRGFSGDGGPAELAQLAQPFAVAISAGGGVLIADRGNDRVRRIDTDGTITTVAGGALAPPTPAGPVPAAPVPPATAPALQTTLSAPAGIAATEDGGFVVADTGHAIVRRYFFGTLTTVAGTGRPGVAADEGTAVKQSLAAPTGVAVAPDGEVLLTDQNNQRVHGVSEDGRLRTVAGTGAIGAVDKPTPSDEAMLAWPTGLAALKDGGALIADTNGHRILRVSAAGQVRVIAGAPASVASARTRTAAGGPTAVLTRSSWAVRRGCSLHAKYRTSIKGIAHLERGDGARVWSGGVTTYQHPFNTPKVRLGYGKHRVYFWVTYGGTDTPPARAKLRVRHGQCR
jgi:NHL repeat